MKFIINKSINLSKATRDLIVSTLVEDLPFSVEVSDEINDLCFNIDDGINGTVDVGMYLINISKKEIGKTIIKLIGYYYV